MLNLEDLQKMARDGELSEKLLTDKEFKEDFKRILREKDGIEVTDEQIPKIIENIENALQGKEDVDLANVSGGVSDAGVLARAAGTILGVVVGAKIGHVGDVYSRVRNGGLKKKKRCNDWDYPMDDDTDEEYEYDESMDNQLGKGEFLGALAGGSLGYGAAALGCKAAERVAKNLKIKVIKRKK